MFFIPLGIVLAKVCNDFGVLVFFVVYELIWLFVVLVELLGCVHASFLFMKV
jgi:hypothetical protein